MEKPDCETTARLCDPDRFFCAMLLPQTIRVAAFTLIALNCELSKALVLPVSGTVTGPMAGLIRLQWWRDVVESPEQGRQSRHEIAVALAGLLEGGIVRKAPLLTLIDAREAELCRFPDWTAWRSAMLDGAGMMQRMVGELLGIADETILTAVTRTGAAFGTGILVRYLPQVLLSGRMPLPEEVFANVGLSVHADGEALLEGTRLETIVSLLRREGLAFLPDRQEIRQARLAMLPAILARRDLARPPVATGAARGVGDRLAVMAAGVMPTVLWNGPHAGSAHARKGSRAP
ncbi:squalene/phytoene synthase family protein [Acetobacter sp.]|uniref:squalene/phytoene synthase family protein n=1 Tax=Acetobacter sp. TaxID=440 RepID=UPI0025C6967E|nr:squalene/phytoene synthase family protein [Acetobacter sp.]MCH4092224.1 squalene/phytoene synthase family protein [Acetobacter sp.]MCI1299859.1 squalene/phytoene synthase family protein [Acetobacter sp.]MCI1315877.1 squalene/phytoene synthase family protein [Acetobacter sp.]